MTQLQRVRVRIYIHIQVLSSLGLFILILARCVISIIIFNFDSALDYHERFWYQVKFFDDGP